MKNLTLFIFAIGLFIASCTKEDTFNTYDIDFGETVNHNKELNVKFLEIADSRCPAEVVCVWQGQAEVTLELDFKEDGNVENLILIKNEANPQLADTIFMDYRLQLLEVNPYPQNEYPDKEEYVIRLLVEGI